MPDDSGSDGEEDSGDEDDDEENKSSRVRIGRDRHDSEVEEAAAYADTDSEMDNMENEDGLVLSEEDIENESDFSGEEEDEPLSEQNVGQASTRESYKRKGDEAVKADLIDNAEEDKGTRGRKGRASLQTTTAVSDTAIGKYILH